jgi:cell division septation protein DedD
VSAVPNSTGKRFTDEQVFSLLRAAEGEPGHMKALCEAYGVTVPAYCLWKARYGQLTLEELRSARAVESRRAFVRHGLVAAAIVVTLATVGLSINAWVAPAEPVTETRLATAAREKGTTPLPVSTASSIQPAASPRTAAPAGVPIAVPDLRPPDTEAYLGYSVQLAAVPDLREASGKVELLTSAGYAAYLLPTTTGDITLHRVRVGPFESLRDAQDVLRRLKRDGYEGGWIAK